MGILHCVSIVVVFSEGVMDANSPPMSESTYSNYSDGAGLYNGQQNASPVCVKSEAQGRLTNSFVFVCLFVCLFYDMFILKCLDYVQYRADCNNSSITLI